MNEPKNPSDIAREALRSLAMRHLPPTPANYQACYNEIAGITTAQPFPEVHLRNLCAEFRVRGEAQAGQLDRLSAAVSRHSWQGVTEALVALVQTTGGPPQAAAAPAMSVLPAEFSGKLARFVECVLPALGEENPRVNGSLGELIALLKQPLVGVDPVEAALGSVSRQVVYAAEEQVEIKASLLKLLYLVIENIGELSQDDSWLKGQIEGVLASVAPPLTLRHLDDMERRLRDVVEKQGRAKGHSVKAQAEMRHMLAEFVERLATMNQSSSTFEGQILASAQLIEQVDSIDELRPLLAGVLEATHQMAEETAKSRDQLKGLQDKVAMTEMELVQLHQELDSASALARHDPLTDVLNRKGLEEALAREISSMRRKQSELSVSLLDIDNFKKLNDSLGHDAGDGALVHLADVTRRHLRPSDTLARYGGEEFVILMPDTRLEQGIDVMIRLQRELTRSLFMSGNEKILITFSAGVAQMAPAESGTDAIRRADQAMYLAKRAGKNRVLGS